MLPRHKQLIALAVFFGGLVLASRLPLAPGQLFSFDDINFAYAIGDFDPRVSQPHPPGYPLFVVQTRLLSWMRFKRAESNLLALALLGSAAALVALALFGDRLLGADAGLCGAWLLVFHPSFWYAGLTSAIRPQLALVSVGVAWTCYRAWRGEAAWIYGGAVALGVGAGIRPEMGLLLFPLWAASVARSGAAWRDRLRAFGVLVVVVLAWLVPTVLQSGGPRSYLLYCWRYLVEQASLTSGLFGAEPQKWHASIVWLLVWTLGGALAWPLATALARRRGEGWGWKRGQLGFLALWFCPSFLFALLVHIADAGQALAMLPVACLVGGHMVSRAASRLEAWLPRPHALVFLLIPSFFLDALIFFRPVWYYKGNSTSGWRVTAERIWADVYSGLHLSSLGQIRGVARLDDVALQELRRLEAERPGRTVVLWERGATSWRKTAYYFPQVPVVVLNDRIRRAGSIHWVTVMQGPRIQGRRVDLAPLTIRLPAGARLVWMVNPKTDFLERLKQGLPLRNSDPLYFCDLPEQDGEARVGSYLLSWAATRASLEL